MRVEFTRSQTASLLGKPKFRLHAIAVLTEQEKQTIKKYGLAKTSFYVETRIDPTQAGTIWKLWLKIIAAFAFNIRITVKDLMQGRIIECKEINEVLSVENQLREASQNFVSYMDAAAGYGGRDVVEYRSAA